MSGRGRPATQPPAGWRAPARRDGCRVQFISEDGRQHKLFDFSRLPGRPEVAEELAVAFEEATGPLGTWKRQKSANNLWTAARKATQWLAHTRPGLTSLAQLSVADARLLALSFRVPSGYGPMVHLRALFRHSPVVSAEVLDRLSHFHGRRDTARQPYTEQEFRWIGTAARGIVRRARTRLRTHWQLVADFRAGRFDQHAPLDPQRCLAEALDHCARTGDIPRSSTTGLPTRLNQRAVTAAGGHSVMTLLHLTSREAWAFAVLLASLTGLNASVLAELPAPHQLASTPDEPGIALVDANKPRRGTRSAMTLPLSALRSQLRPPGGDTRPPKVLNTSLTTAFGVFTLLVELTEPGRRLVGSQQAFVFYNGIPAQPGGRLLKEGLPNITTDQRRVWLREVLTGDEQRDQVLAQTSLDRLRKTYLQQHRRPVAHTPATLARYLRRMRTVTEEGFQIVREALDEQVADALARRRMVVAPTAADGADGVGQDTVLGSCEDFDHSPLDGGGACRQTFLSCLDCGNARAFPRHLPLQLVVLDELRARQATVPLERWATDFAGRVAQLEEIVNEYEPAQRAHARSQITDAHRRLTVRLFAGDLDPL